EGRNHLFQRVLTRRAQIAAEEALTPGALITLVRDQADANLVDSERQRVVDMPVAVARLDTAIEEQATMYTFQRLHRGLVGARTRRRTRIAREPREDLGTD